MPVSKKDSELLELGKQLQAFYDFGYVQRRRMLWFTFVKGVLSGFGAVIGGTVVIALLLWFLSSLKELPFVGPLSNSIQTTIQQKHR